MKRNSVAVFCGSSNGNSEVYLQKAEILGKNKLENFLHEMIIQGFYKQSHFNQLLFTDSDNKILEYVQNFEPEYIKKL